MALDFGAGCVGGAAGVVAGYPLDTVKVKIQTQDVSSGRLMYNGTFDCLKQIINKEGARSLYKGMSSPLIGVAGINAITFGAYGNVLRQLSNPESIGSVALAGSAAGMIQSFIVSPMELVKTQMQVCGQNGITDAIKTIYTNGGLTGLARGFGITVLREVPAFGIYFGSYEVMLRRFGDSTPVVLIAGGMAGIFSWIFTYPQDVIKSRLQADSFGMNQQYSSARHCLQASIETEGYGCLTRGIGSTIVRAFPMNAVTFGVYSYIMKRWGYKEEDRDLDTVENLKKNLQNHISELSAKLTSPLEEGKEKNKKPQLSTMVTDMPNILTVQEPLISPISFIRMYPEQMLWACPETPKKDPWEEFTKKVFAEKSFTNYCNYNQFTQRAPLNDLYQAPEIIAPAKVQNQKHDPFEPDTPSLLGGENSEKWKTCIMTKDFLLPTNLLSSRKSPDRIYGFYYLVV